MENKYYYPNIFIEGDGRYGLTLSTIIRKFNKKDGKWYDVPVNILHKGRVDLEYEVNELLRYCFIVKNDNRWLFNTCKESKLQVSENEFIELFKLTKLRPWTKELLDNEIST